MRRRSPSEGQADPLTVYRCGGCRAEAPLKEALATSSGLACINCYGAMNAMPGTLPGGYRMRDYVVPPNVGGASNQRLWTLFVGLRLLLGLPF